MGKSIVRMLETNKRHPIQALLGHDLTFELLFTGDFSMECLAGKLVKILYHQDVHAAFFLQHFKQPITSTSHNQELVTIRNNGPTTTKEGTMDDAPPLAEFKRSACKCSSQLITHSEIFSFRFVSNKC
jgi:hypothetical protein